MSEDIFIKTKDSNTAEELRKIGYTEMPMENMYYVFINDSNKKFESNIVGNAIFSNKLCI